MKRPLDIVILGLSLSSSWGNGHATTYRALLRALDAAGHKVTFLERDVPWYASNRDLAAPDFCDLVFYTDPDELVSRHAHRLAGADAVVIGSYVPDGVEVIDAVADLGPKRLCFYDIDTPVTLAKLERGDEEFLARRQVATFDIYFFLLRRPNARPAAGRVRRAAVGTPLLRRRPRRLSQYRRGYGVGPRLSRHLQPRQATRARTPVDRAGAALAGHALRRGRAELS